MFSIITVKLKITTIYVNCFNDVQNAKNERSGKPAKLGAHNALKPIFRALFEITAKGH